MSSTQYTRCPNCQTVFHLQHEQLELAGGKVRCGSCFNVFDASLYLVDPSTAASTEIKKSSQAAGNPSSTQEDAPFSIEDAFQALEEEVDMFLEQTATTDQNTTINADMLNTISDEIASMDSELGEFEKQLEQQAAKRLSISIENKDDNEDLNISDLDFDLEDVPSVEELSSRSSTPSNIEEPSKIPEEHLHATFSEDETQKTEKPRLQLIKGSAGEIEETDEPIGIAQFSDDIDYEGFDEEENESTQAQTYSSNLTDKTDIYDDDTLRFDDDFDPDSIEDLEAYTKSLREELSENRPEQYHDDDDDFPSQTVELDESLASDLDSFTKTLIKDLERSKEDTKQSRNRTAASVDKLPPTAVEIDNSLVEDLDRFAEQLAQELALKEQSRSPSITEAHLETPTKVSLDKVTSTSLTQAHLEDPTINDTPNTITPTVLTQAHLEELEEAVSDTKTASMLAHTHPKEPNKGSLTTRKKRSEPPSLLDDEFNDIDDDFALISDDTDISYHKVPLPTNKKKKPAAAFTAKPKAPAPKSKNTNKPRVSTTPTTYEKKLEAKLTSAELTQEYKALRKGNALLKATWVLGSIALMAALYSQVIWVKRETLSQSVIFRPHLIFMCNVFDCSVPPRQDLNQLKLRNSAVTPSTKKSDVLEVRLLIINIANFEQPFPKIKLTFTDQLGKNIAARIFTPDEYKLTSKEIKTIPPSTEVNIRFSVKQPNKKVTGYQFDFL